MTGDEAPTTDDVVVKDTFDVPSSDEDIATQLKELSDALRGRIRTLDPDTVVVRRADIPPRPTNQEGPRIRLMAEGAIIASARSLVEQTIVRTGKECGAAYGTTKSEVDASAAGLLATTKQIPAAAAALSGLMGDREL